MKKAWCALHGRLMFFSWLFVKISSSLLLYDQTLRSSPVPWGHSFLLSEHVYIHIQTHTHTCEPLYIHTHTHTHPLLLLLSGLECFPSPHTHSTRPSRLLPREPSRPLLPVLTNPLHKCDYSAQPCLVFLEWTQGQLSPGCEG